MRRTAAASTKHARLAPLFPLSWSALPGLPRPGPNVRLDSHLSLMTIRACPADCTRKKPTQERGAKRVAALLEAAVGVFSSAGYENATMSAIAARAGSQIGSLYQFFPNKEAIARALRTGHVEDVERMVADLRAESAGWATPRLVDRFVQLMIRFVENHPAFLPLLDAPSSTEPTGARKRLRATLSSVLIDHQPRLPGRDAGRMAEVILRINKALMGEFARAAPLNREWLAAEYRRLLRGYLEPRLGSPTKRAPRPGAHRRASVSNRPSPRKRARVGRRPRS